ncbi:MAG: hypothetical protein VXY91_04755 [Bacteroidota bacterium]|nr:hypothetical protein [Bacteroidota bacterium]
MRALFLIFLFAFVSFSSKAQAKLVIEEVDMGILAGYHSLLTNPSAFILGEEYELGGYLKDTKNGGVISFSTSYLRNGAFGTNVGLPQYNYNVGRFSSAKVRFGKLWEGDFLDFFLNVGFGYMTGADQAEKIGFIDLLYLDPENPVNVFTIPIGLDIQWYGWDGSTNALGFKYEINGWANYFGVGFTYLL